MLKAGWDVSAIFSQYSGQFLTPQWTGPDPVGTAFTSSRTPAQVTLRPDHLRDAALPADSQGTGRWFDSSAFAPPAAGRYGTAAKGVIKGPGSNVVNAGIAKSFWLREGLRARLELTSTNLFNHPNWANPGVNISQAAQTGVITATGGVANLDASGARNFRAGVRLEW